MIVCIGNPVYDLIRTPHVATHVRVLSGCSTNACLAVRKLGQPAILVGRVGQDFLEQFSEDMRRYGIAYTVHPTSETGGFGLVYDEAGDRTLDILGIADPLDAVPAEVAEADFVLVGPILGEVHPGLVQEIARRTGAPLMLDPQGMMRRVANGRVERYRSAELLEVLPLFDVVKPNEHEARVLTGIDARQQPEAAVRALFGLMVAEKRTRRHAPIAVVTLAEAGSVIFDGGQTFEIPAYRTVARDPTGAGDTYAGGFMYQYGRTPDDLHRVGCFASAVASVMVEHTGPGFPLTPEEAERRTDTLMS